MRSQEVLDDELHGCSTRMKLFECIGTRSANNIPSKLFWDNRISARAWVTQQHLNKDNSIDPFWTLETIKTIILSLLEKSQLFLNRILVASSRLSIERRSLIRLLIILDFLVRSERKYFTAFNNERCDTAKECRSRSTTAIAISSIDVCHCWCQASYPARSVECPGPLKAWHLRMLHLHLALLVPREINCVLTSSSRIGPRWTKLSHTSPWCRLIIFPSQVNCFG